MHRRSGFRTIALKGTAIFVALVLPILIAALPFAANQTQIDWEKLLAAESPRVTRLFDIAEALQDPKANHTELLTEAVRKCGFEIWNESREKVADPVGAPPLNLAITDVEIKRYAAMFKRGDHMRFGDLIASIDHLWKNLDFDGSTETAIREFLEASTSSPNSSIRASGCFIFALDSYHHDSEAHLPENDAKLDAIQVLLLLRIVTEDIANPVRNAIKKVKPPLSGSDSEPSEEGERGLELEQAAPPPGWAGDAWVGGYTGLVGQAIDASSGGGWADKTARNMSHRIAILQATLSFIKFITTYEYLKGTITVEPPGNPLVRTKNRQAGEKRTLAAHFYIDGKAITDWMKDNRYVIALTGIDVDMPRSGDLAGVETMWKADDGPTGDPRDLIEAVNANIDRVRTGPDGVAKTTWQGVPQKADLDPRKVTPHEKTVMIEVSPQAKATEMGQDITDAVLGVIGVKTGGAAGVLGIVQELLFRAKWKVGARIVLGVRDWDLADIVCQLDLEFVGSGSTLRPGSYSSQSVSRIGQIRDMQMVFIGSTLDQLADLSKVPPGTIKTQMEEYNQRIREAADKPEFHAAGPGTIDLRVNDSYVWTGYGGGCGESKPGSSSSTTVGRRAETVQNILSGGVGGEFSIRMKLSQKKAWLRLPAQYVKVTTRSRGNPPSDREMKLTDQLSLISPVEGIDIEIPLKVTEIPGMATTNYYGTTPVVFEFGDSYRRNGIVSFSITRKKKPTP